MGSDDDNNKELGLMTRVAQEFRDVAASMSDSVLQACRADAVLFSFETGQSARRAILSYGLCADDALTQPLEQFCLGKHADGRAYEPGGVHLHQRQDGTEFVFVLVPLREREQTFGAMALAISRRNWAEQSVFAACAQVARLVSMNLRSALLRTQLEDDLAELNHRTRLLQRLSEIDPLTEVENKASFETHARARLTRGRAPAALLVIDLDHFKEVNDIYGHPFGDSYLKTVAQALRDSLPRRSVIGRIGGDEFAALIGLPEAGPQAIAEVLAGMRTRVQRDVAALGKTDLGQLSIGVSLFPEHGADFSDLFALADSALYQSKEAGRNTTTLHGYAPDSDAAAARLATARRGDFASVTAEFQPIVDLTTGACVGLEALARPIGASQSCVTEGLAWMFRDHLIAPRLTRHILRRALQDIAGLPHGLRPDLWLNLTKFDILDASFVTDVQAELDRCGLEWSRLVAEVHEDVILGDRHGQVFSTLQEIRRRGGRIALDDFGTGYAGLTHLRDWPVDIIKLDQSFNKAVAQDAHAQVVIKALMMITRSRRIEIVAEGLETEAQVAAITALGCRYGQGYAFDAALPAARLPERLQLYRTAAEPPGEHPALV